METIILLNEEDRKEGFFVFSTSKAVDYQRLIRRIGGEENLIDTQVSTQGKKVVEWICKVPIEFISKSTFSIGKKRQVNLTPERRAELAERMKNARKPHTEQI
jgi:hypothetical protein